MHVGRLIRKPYLEMIELLYKRLEQEGFEGTNVMYSPIFQFIDTGKRLTQLATLAKTSKQHMKFLLGNLEKMGYTQKVPDPTDKRAVIYSLTKKGHDRRARSYEVLAEIERTWSEFIGPAKMDELKLLLTDLGG